MIKFYSFLFLLAFISLASNAQEKPSTEKEATLTSGIGIAGATHNAKALGGYAWLQLNYRFSKNFSVATEFENMSYKLNGYYIAVSPKLNDINAVDNNFSLLLKYHIDTKSALQIAVASGWTYTIRSREYYRYERDSTAQSWTRNVSSYDDYQVPLLLEIKYPLWKRLAIQARLKYNLNPQNGSTYSSGIGLSLKL